MTLSEQQDLLKLVSYKNFEFFIRKSSYGYTYLQIEWNGLCAVKKIYERQYSRRWLISPAMTKSEIIQTAFKAVLTAEEHEVRESFTYKGQAIFNPHFDCDKLTQFDFSGNGRQLPAEGDFNHKI